MFDLKWSRKAYDWDEVTADRRAWIAIEGLQAFPAGSSPMDTFPDSRPSLHLTYRTNGDWFLVDSQGYDYARYAVRIVGKA